MFKLLKKLFAVIMNSIPDDDCDYLITFEKED